ncbi:MAG: sulfotransferase [Pyrinomonadaceae bacterium]|nr:sulfotransferase [Pyrinomonadaceae bacterium]
MTLANLLVIGAMKSGTTSLHRYLNLHPEIQMAGPKELNFFVKPEDCLVPQGDWHRGLDWYRQWFAGDYPVRGESSHHYSAHPVIRGASDRAAQIVPDARLIYIVRDPVERIVSHYMERRIDGLESRPLEEVMVEALAAPEMNTYICRSLYFMQASRWLERFPRDRLLVLAFEDLRDRPVETLRRAFRFLEVDETFMSDEFHRNANPSSQRLEPKPSMARLERLRRRRGARKRTIAPRQLVPARARGALRAAWRGAAMRSTDRPELSTETRERLAKLVRDDAERLRELTEERYPGWSV